MWNNSPSFSASSPIVDEWSIKPLTVIELQEWLNDHPFSARISWDVLRLIFLSFDHAQHIHQRDLRRNGEPYITHPIWIVIAFITAYPNTVKSNDAIVMILHDAIEDHPEYWIEILKKYGISVFHDILLLTGISASYRDQMLEYFKSLSDQNPEVANILQILDSASPLEKLDRSSGQSKKNSEEGLTILRNAFLLYQLGITHQSKNQWEAQDEFISTGNYLYFRPIDARRKLHDMLHNMLDMEQMEAKKPGYREKRRIKAYILGVILRNLNMTEEYAQLESAFRIAWSTMYSDEEAVNKIAELQWIDADQSR